MKSVSFKVAKAIKEAGYPQYGHCDEFYDSNGNRVSKFCDIHKLVYPCPTYLEVWLWLWREKGICIEIKDNCYYILAKAINQRFHGDPLEESIISAIDYLVEHDRSKLLGQ